MDEPKLTTEAVYTIMNACLFSDEEVKDGPGTHPTITIAGIATKEFVFHCGRIKAHKKHLQAMLREVPDDFFVHLRGASFAQLPVNKRGQPWADHNTAEAFAVLCFAAGLGNYTLAAEHRSHSPSPHISFYSFY